MKEVRRFQHTDSIDQVAFSPDSKVIATDNQLWEVSTGKKLHTLPLLPPDSRSSTSLFLAFSPDGRQIALHRYQDIVLVQVRTGQEVGQLKLLPHETTCRESVPRVAFTPDGKNLVSARNDEGLVRVWSVATGKELRHFAYDLLDGGQSGAPVSSLGVSADGKQVMVHSQKADDVVLLELATGKERARHSIANKESLVHFSTLTPDGTHLIYARKNRLHQINLKTGKETQRFEGVGKYVFYVAVSPDGKYLAASVRDPKSEKDWVQCWERASGKSLQVFKADQNITSLAFSPEGNYLLWGSSDKTARLMALVVQ